MGLVTAFSHALWGGLAGKFTHRIELEMTAKIWFLPIFRAPYLYSKMLGGWTGVPAALFMQRAMAADCHSQQLPAVLWADLPCLLEMTPLQKYHLQALRMCTRQPVKWHPKGLRGLAKFLSCQVRGFVVLFTC